MSNQEDPEVAALAAITSALAAIDDEQARARVLKYAVGRFAPNAGLEIGEKSRGQAPPFVGAPPPAHSGGGEHGHSSSKEMPGIARLTDGGELKITIRDLKAKSGLDAAARLATVSIFAYNHLAGQPLSSSKGLTPILKQWRLYDGNTRKKIASDKGILRDGDSLTLDAHAERDAQRYIEEIRDSSIEGNWKPSR